MQAVNRYLYVTPLLLWEAFPKPSYSVQVFPSQQRHFSTVPSSEVKVGDDGNLAGLVSNFQTLEYA